MNGFPRQPHAAPKAAAPQRRTLAALTAGLAVLLATAWGAAGWGSAHGAEGALPTPQHRVGAAGAATPGAEGASAAFRIAEGRRRWAFPRDHGRHPDYRLEWWYYTGNLTAEDGERFGFQVTFFRRGVAPHHRRPSAWAVRSLYLGHAALSDIGAGRHHRTADVGRDSLDMSGASLERHEVWLHGWRAEPLPDDPHGVRLRAGGERFSLELSLRAAKPPVLHGDGGLDRKGREPGQASWYYSLPRLDTRGRVVLDGRAYEVHGTSWMDHEFGSGQLGDDQVGWDWFAIRLEDGRELMLYRLRRRDGTIEPLSAGSLIGPEGGRRALRIGPGGVRMTPGRRWRSESTGAEYPVAWRIAVPGAALELDVRPAFDAQEMAPMRGIPFPYWEGAITVHGRAAGEPVRGEGYMELTGYAEHLSEYFR